MRWPGGVLIAVVLILTGCTGSKKNLLPKPSAESGEDGSPRADDRPFWETGNARRPSPPSRPNKTSDPLIPASRRDDEEVAIAGRLIDDSGRPARNATIELVTLTANPSRTTSRPIVFSSDDKGIFLIEGLKSSVEYKLNIRCDEDGRTIAGSAQTVAPNLRMLVRLTEDQVSSSTPDAQPHVGDVGPFAPKTKPPTALPGAVGGRPPGPPPLDPVPSESGPTGTLDEGPRPGVKPPAGREGYSPNPPAVVQPDRIGTTPGTRAAVPAVIPPVAVDVPIYTPGPVDPVAPRPSAMGSPPPLSLRDTRKTVSQETPSNPSRIEPKYNFRLSDTLGNPWDLRTASGELILLDFWSTTCQPCLASMPTLKKLAFDYGPRGLEVVGIACEQHERWKDRANAARDVADAKELNYRVYLEEDKKGENVQRLFSIRGYPTLILLNRRGDVLWRGHPKDHKALEGVIREALGQ